MGDAMLNFATMSSLSRTRALEAEVLDAHADDGVNVISQGLFTKRGIHRTDTGGSCGVRASVDEGT